eukprot:COSAG01_NODE_963_length_12407_cov_38.330598_2_plen_180_part_00
MSNAAVGLDTILVTLSSCPVDDATPSTRVEECLLYLRDAGELFGLDWIDERRLVDHLAALGAFAGQGGKVSVTDADKLFQEEWLSRGSFWDSIFRLERQQKRHKNVVYIFWRRRDLKNVARTVNLRLLDFLTETRRRQERAAAAVQFSLIDNPSKKVRAASEEFHRIDVPKLCAKVPAK